MATIVRTETRRRGIFGTIMWWVFLGYNALMAFGFLSGLKNAGEVVERSADEASKAGAALGTIVGAGAILVIWLIGALVLGLIVALTRGKKVTVERVVE